MVSGAPQQTCEWISAISDRPSWVELLGRARLDSGSTWDQLQAREFRTAGGEL